MTTRQKIEPANPDPPIKLSFIKGGGRGGHMCSYQCITGQLDKL